MLLTLKTCVNKIIYILMDTILYKILNFLIYVLFNLIFYFCKFTTVYISYKIFSVNHIFYFKLFKIFKNFK